MNKNKELIVRSEVTLQDHLSKPVKFGKVQKAIESVLNASEYFTGYEITITIESRWKDKDKAGT